MKQRMRANLFHEVKKLPYGVYSAEMIRQKVRHLGMSMIEILRQMKEFAMYVEWIEIINDRANRTYFLIREDKPERKKKSG